MCNTFSDDVLELDSWEQRRDVTFKFYEALAIRVTIGVINIISITSTIIINIVMIIISITSKHIIIIIIIIVIIIYLFI